MLLFSKFQRVTRLLGRIRRRKLRTDSWSFWWCFNLEYQHGCDCSKEKTLARMLALRRASNLAKHKGTMYRAPKPERRLGSLNQDTGSWQGFVRLLKFTCCSWASS